VRARTQTGTLQSSFCKENVMHCPQIQTKQIKLSAKKQRIVEKKWSEIGLSENQIKIWDSI